jgi:hypothetical protein
MICASGFSIQSFRDAGPCESYIRVPQRIDPAELEHRLPGLCAAFYPKVALAWVISSRSNLDRSEFNHVSRMEPS